MITMPLPYPVQDVPPALRAILMTGKQLTQSHRARSLPDGGPARLVGCRGRTTAPDGAR